MPEFILTAPPPSVNAMYANAKCGRIKTRKYKAWIAGELKALLSQRAQAVQCPVEITIVLPASMRGDVDNRVKAINDLLVTAGVIPNDSAKFVEKVQVFRGSLFTTRVSVESRSTSAARKA